MDIYTSQYENSYELIRRFFLAQMEKVFKTILQEYTG